MAEVLVVSDSHGATSRVHQIAELFQSGRFQAILHLGDVAGDAKRLSEQIGREVVRVSGNCDALSSAPRERIWTFEDVRLLMTHGDRYGVKSGLERLSYRAEEADCPVALFGHTHRAFAGYVGKTLLVNPGALREGRYAIVNFEGKRVVPRLLRLFQE